MGRPPNADAERTRRAILHAATDAFGRAGLAGCTVRTIAEQVGVTFAAVHHHFGTKEALFEACLDQAFAELGAIAQEIAEAVARAAPHGKVAAGVRTAFRAALARPERSRFLLRAYVFEQQRVRDKLADAQRVLAGSAESLLEADGRFGVRIPVVALGMLITRMAVGSDEERAFFAEEVGSDAEAMERYLVAVAEATLHPAEAA